ncbi:MAG: NHLP family bacteriocin export ABC transporter peptidase/permease/ATPase subunit [Butyrivibrio sp.]|nr:NHLP family bacteriocin export ABC transporter peptidase/permease/ATPase subunit [Butyrivibrio sp.]
MKRKNALNVPVIMQMEALECGAACLDMILAYYGKWVPLEQIRADCGVSRDGSNAKNIIVAARNYGLDAKGYRYEVDTLLEGGSFPCIIHWEFDHFMVLKGAKGGFVYINDPARGSIKMPLKEFDEGFTGIALCFEPTEKFVKSGRRKSTLEFALGRLKGAGALVSFVVLSSIIAYIFNVIDPAFHRFFMDRLLSGENKELLMPFVFILFALSLLHILISGITEIYSLKIDGKMAVLGSSSYIWKVLHLPMEFFSQRFAGDIIQRKETNATISKTLVEVFAPIALNAFMMFFYMFFMLRYSVGLTVVGLATLLINAVLGRIISQKRVNITRLSLRDQGKLASTTLSGVRMIETIKSSGSEVGFFKKWAGYQALVTHEKIEYSHINIWLGMVPELLSFLSNYLVLIIGVGLVMKGEFTLGMITGFQLYLTHFNEPAMKLIGAGQSIQEMRSNMERLDDVMNYPVDPAFSGKTEEIGEYSKLMGNIEIKNVTFGYSRLAEPVIRDFSLDIEAGSKIAIVGASGCGKSTLSKLLSGLYRPWSGEILFGGKRISEIDRNVFTGSVAVVDQDIIMFEDSIDQNIKLWDNSIEDFEVILAARDARIHDEIMERPEGYKAHVEEDGKNFSGGQRQRLEIARVLACDPSVIILDEATSALDSVTEKEVVESIKKRGITCIVIAHRLSTIRDCDKIVVLSDGEIVDTGTHEQLMERCEYYKDLVTSE